MKRFLLAVIGLGAFGVATALAQGTQAPKKEEKKSDEEVIKREEVVVVSASKVESTVINSPATISVVGADTIASSPAQNYGDLLRSVPGLNVIQMSARDINLTARQATSTLTNSQLVLLDGRSIYLDFFGLVLWDFVPQSPDQIKQIEVVRGPASAVWGANALTGVVNMITKSPREARGFGATLTAGLVNRDAGSREGGKNGYSFGGDFSFAQAPSDKLAWRLSAGYFNSDPYARPVGTVPTIPQPFLDPSITVNCNATPLPDGCVGGGVYPVDEEGLGSFVNQGTSQPKADLRIDQEFLNGARMTYQGGYSGTDGIIHTGIGPFNIQNGAKLMYGKLQYTKGALRIATFGNFTDVDAPNELALDDEGRPLVLSFKTQTYDLEVGNSNVIGGQHILSYGGNARRNNFDISITPNGQDRWEFGGYFQEEFFVDKFRVAAGVRVDKFGNLDKAFFSPRVSVMFKPAPDHALRVSFNRAFRSPSTINNYLERAILAPPPSGIVDLRPLAPFLPPSLKPFVAEPFLLRVLTVGNPDLGAHSLNAYEFSYTGALNHGKTTLGLAVYQNDENHDINFTSLTELPVSVALQNGLTFYSATNPARGFGLVTNRPITLPGALMTILAGIPPQLGGPIVFPETTNTYLNLGKLRHRGVEVSIDHQFTNEVSAFANYSYQDKPKPLNNNGQTCPTTLVPGAQIPSPQDCYPVTEIGIPPKSRFNAGVNVNTKRILASLSVNYADKAYWQDVFAPDFAGYTDSFTMVNATLGAKWADGKVVTSLKGTNLFNKTIQQQIYGDLLKLGLVAEVRIFVK